LRRRDGGKSRESEVGGREVGKLAPRKFRKFRKFDRDEDRPRAHD
jgi:hypothetical protein